MPVTLVTAGLCGLLYIMLSWRVVQVRVSARVLLGDGGDGLLLQRIRAHANFAEYVPFCLILIFVVENSLFVSPPWLWVVGLALVAARVFHAIGMTRGRVNAWRTIGTVATLLIMAGLSAAALVVAATLPA